MSCSTPAHPSTRKPHSTGVWWKKSAREKNSTTSVDTRVQAILRAAPLAVRAQKRLMNEWSVLPLEQAVSRGIDYLSEAYQTTEPAEAIEKLQAARRT